MPPLSAISDLQKEVQALKKENKELKEQLMENTVIQSMQQMKEIYDDLFSAHQKLVGDYEALMDEFSLYKRNSISVITYNDLRSSLGVHKKNLARYKNTVTCLHENIETIIDKAKLSFPLGCDNILQIQNSFSSLINHLQLCIEVLERVNAPTL